MFEKSVEELTELGAQITTAEIAQQPELWRDTLNIYRENKEAIEAFLAEARAMGEGRLSVVFTGAGTSDYVGDTCAPYLRHAGNTDLYDFKPIATTDIVSAPARLPARRGSHARGFLCPLWQQPREPCRRCRCQGARPQRQVPQHHLRSRGQLASSLPMIPMR